ncbi:TPA: hypothetical protein NJ572_005166 [Vibrio parahaemolyticus]|nr:hypothetical protein [Vibrio parahaemolyticus]HCG8708257.1 hypothetical protein [Vibrio parahaemolyticus]
MNQQQLITLLLQAINGGSQQQNLLQQLLGGQQSQQQDFLPLLTGVSNQNPLQSLLGGSQQPQIDTNTLTLLVQQLQGGQQQQPQIDPQILAALQTALGGQNGNAGKGGLLDLLKGSADTGQEDDLRDAIKFNLEFCKFIEDNQDNFPSWFEPKEAIAQVEKWAKNDTEKAQALSAATVKAFFKNESAVELLEERDRTFVKDNILKDGIKESEIDRKQAWPMIQRALHNKCRLAENEGTPNSGSDAEVMKAYGSIFEQGQKPNVAPAE